MPVVSTPSPVDDPDAPPIDGLRLDAEVVAVHEEVVLVRLAGGQEAGVPLGDFRRSRSDVPVIEVGERFEVLVEHRSQDGRRWIASRDKAMRLGAFEAVHRAFQAGEKVEGEIVGTVEGGFSVDIGIRAFLPGSQVAMRPIRHPEEVLGQRFSFRILRFDRGRQNVVLSRRALLETERDAKLARLKVGALVSGTVRSLTDYGAFVDIGGGVEGLLHIGEMSWSALRRPEEAVHVGEVLTVKVIELDREKRRIALSLRQLQDDPWLTVKERYPEGQRVQGWVVSKTDFGCFLELEPGLEGLVHSTGTLVAPTDAAVIRKADIGDELEAQVVDIDVEAKRLSLVLVHGAR